MNAEVDPDDLGEAVMEVVRKFELRISQGYMYAPIRTLGHPHSRRRSDAIIKT